MFMLKSTRNAVIAGALLVAINATASADDRPDVDIESLRGDLRPAGGEWLLEVRYEVEVEDYRPFLGELELILFVTENGYTLVDQTGRPIEIGVPLDYPSDRDDDELEFEDRFTITLPDTAIGDPDHLRLEGVVVHAGDDRPLDRKDKSIHFERPKSRVRYGGVTGFGIGLSVRSAGRHHSSILHRRVVGRRVGVTRHSASVERRRIGVTRQRVGVDHRRVGIGRHHDSRRSHSSRIDRHRPSTRSRSGHVERRSSERRGRARHSVRGHR